MESLSLISPINLPMISFLLFAIVFVAYFIYCFFIIYHLTRFGVGAEPKAVALIFFIGVIILLPPAAIFFSKMDAIAAFSVFISNIQAGPGAF